MLELIDLSCQRGERRLFRNLNLSIAPGQLVAVTGENGSGKTSLLRMLCGLLPPEDGAIRWEGESIATLGDAYSGRLLYLGHLNGLKDDLTPLENLRFSARLSGAPVSDVDCRGALEAVGLTGTVLRLPAGVLSQGQKRRAALARLWLSSRPLWILDEPFAALDDQATRALTSRLESHVRGGGIVVAATHQDIGVAPHMLRQVRVAG